MARPNKAGLAIVPARGILRHVQARSAWLAALLAAFAAEGDNPEQAYAKQCH